jgi:hypothetical protein
MTILITNHLKNVKLGNCFLDSGTYKLEFKFFTRMDVWPTRGVRSLTFRDIFK